MDIGDMETRLFNIFQQMSSFAFDRAKELAEKEKDFLKGLHPYWTTLINILSQVILSEKQYLAFAFLQPKSFLRKDNSLKATYENHCKEFRKLEMSLFANKSEVEKLTSKIVNQFPSFLSARIDLMDFYERLYTLGANGKLMPYLDLANQISRIDQHHGMKLRNNVLAPVKENLTHECGMLKDFLEALHDMNNWEFFKALIKIDSATKSMQEWSSIYEASKEHRKIRFTGAFLLRPQQDPLLLQWFGKLKGEIVSKFSLYFHDVLLRQSTPQDIKSLVTKLPNDYINKISNFQKKSDALAVCLVFDATNLDGGSLFKGPGYHHPNKIVKPQTGIELYPAAFSCPGPQPPMNHWPNLIMILTDFAEDLSSRDKVVYFHDSRAQNTYFLCQIDSRMTLAVIYETKKTEKDSLICNFLLETSSMLKSNHIFVGLRPGSR